MSVPSSPAFIIALEDLFSRFLVNLPPAEVETTNRIFFQIEQAHWFYEDFLREKDEKLPGLTLKRFGDAFFRYCPTLKNYNQNEVDAIYDEFLVYKNNVPVCGAIILNETMDKILLVKGWAKSSSWSFPKGKINQEESEIDCAIREVDEETGLDVAKYISEDEYLELNSKGEQRTRLYICPGIPETTVFVTKTRKEISRIAWHRITDLPNVSKKGASDTNDAKYFLVQSFMPHLLPWINQSRLVTTQSKSIQKATDSPRTKEDNASHLRNLLGIGHTPTRPLPQSMDFGTSGSSNLAYTEHIPSVQHLLGIPPMPPPLQLANSYTSTIPFLLNMPPVANSFAAPSAEIEILTNPLRNSRISRTEPETGQRNLDKPHTNNTHDTAKILSILKREPQVEPILERKSNDDLRSEMLKILKGP